MTHALYGFRLLTNDSSPSQPPNLLLVRDRFCDVVLLRPFYGDMHRAGSHCRPNLSDRATPHFLSLSGFVDCSREALLLLDTRAAEAQ